MTRALLCLLLAGCRTTTASAPPPSAAWDDALVAETALTPLNDKTEAIALDFVHQRRFGLTGRLNAWLRWLDEQAPKGQVEALPFVPGDAPLTVTARIGDGAPTACRLDSTRAHTSLARTLFDSSVLGAKLEAAALDGVHVRLGEAEFGPLTVELTADSPCTIGLDVLSKVVLLVPLRGRNSVWLLVVPPS